MHTIPGLLWFCFRFGTSQLHPHRGCLSNTGIAVVSVIVSKAFLKIGERNEINQMLYNQEDGDKAKHNKSSTIYNMNLNNDMSMLQDLLTW